jgi:hypothetical protein
MTQDTAAGAATGSTPAVSVYTMDGLLHHDAGDTAGALFSPDQRYRYALWRRWGMEGESVPLVVIGLNPSTADATTDDPTVRRCIAFAKREGLGGLLMLNLFAFRSTDPAALYAEADPVGPRNDECLAYFAQCVATDAGRLVAAWGAHGAHRYRSARVVELIQRAGARLECLGTTKSGQPRHPLYLKGDTPFQNFLLRTP